MELRSTSRIQIKKITGMSKKKRKEKGETSSLGLYVILAYM